MNDHQSIVAAILLSTAAILATSCGSGAESKSLALEQVEKGRAYLEAKDVNAVIRCCDEAIRNDPSLAEAYLLRATAYAEHMNLADGKLPDNVTQDDRLRDADQALRLKPDCGEAHVQRGYALLELRRDDDARQAFEAAIPLLEDPTRALEQTALAAFRRDEHKRAVSDMDRLIELHPSDPIYHKIRSLYRRAAGDHQGALDDSAQAERLHEKAMREGSLEVYQDVELSKEESQPPTEPLKE